MPDIWAESDRAKRELQPAGGEGKAPPEDCEAEVLALAMPLDPVLASGLIYWAKSGLCHRP